MIIIQYLLFSIFIVIIGHFIWNFLLDKYTRKKVKNEGSMQIEKYKHLFDELEKNINSGEKWDSNKEYMNENTYISPPYIEDEQKISMIHELSTYMQSI